MLLIVYRDLSSIVFLSSGCEKYQDQYEASLKIVNLADQRTYTIYEQKIKHPTTLLNMTFRFLNIEILYEKLAATPLEASRST